ncbi:MAG: type II secretion system F family protein [Pseudomonadota bacterium]
MDILPFMLICGGAIMVLAMMVFAFSGPSAGRAGSRRLDALRERHGDAAIALSGTQARRLAAANATRADAAAMRFLPNPEALKKRLAMTGKSWTVGQYGKATAGLFLVVLVALWLKGAPFLLALLFGLFVGTGLPHFVVNWNIKRRINKFTVKFPDGIDLLVRGLRSGLPISETIAVVGQEIDGPVGEEFRLIADRMKIGRTMEAAMQETADRLGTPEFQFFVITIAIQRETGGNLAETLNNLADVLRKRAQMKLKIKAMSSESKASAYIVGSLPFIVFVLIWMISGDYMQSFFVEPRLIIAGIGGLVWMSLGAFIMSRMVSFEI